MSAGAPPAAEPTAADIAAGLWLLGQALLLEGLVPPPEAENSRENTGGTRRAGSSGSFFVRSPALSPTGRRAWG